MMQKLIRNHQWITRPDNKGISYFGLTDFAKQYFLRLDSISHEQFFKTNYGISYKNRIGSWIQQVKTRYDLKTDVLSSLPNITMSERMQFDRFCLKQDEPFSELRTVQFNVNLSAPVPMRVMEYNYIAEYAGDIFNLEWIYKVEVLDLKSLDSLMTEQKYKKSNKVIQYEGMLL